MLQYSKTRNNTKINKYPCFKFRNKIHYDLQYLKKLFVLPITQLRIVFFCVKRKYANVGSARLHNRRSNIYSKPELRC